jgi:hypothetical protein
MDAQLVRALLFRDAALRISPLVDGGCSLKLRIFRFCQAVSANLSAPAKTLATPQSSEESKLSGRRGEWICWIVDMLDGGYVSYSSADNTVHS